MKPGSIPNKSVWVHKRGQSIKKPNFFNLLLYLQLNQTCLLQSTPLHSWYTAPNLCSSSGTRPGTCFARWREGPLSNFLPSPLLSEIGELLVTILTSRTIKTPQGPNLESRAAEKQHSSHASSKIHGTRVTREQEHCHGAASRCSFVHVSGLFLRTASLKRTHTLRPTVCYNHCTHTRLMHVTHRLLTFLPHTGDDRIARWLFYVIVHCLMMGQ